MPTVLDVLIQKLRTSNPELDESLRTFERYWEAFKKFADQVQPYIAAFVKAIDESPDIFKNAIVSMANHGWYLDNTGMYLEDVLKFGYELKDDVHSGNTKLMEHFRSRIDNLENELIGSNPDRKDVINEGFSNHREGKYNSSILIFLSQADGIFANYFDGSPFKPKIRNKVYKNHCLNGLISHLLLNGTIPIWISADDKYVCITGLNRHQVMHGKNPAYGTEENSLKAMSFLGFLNTLCNESLPPTPVSSDTL